MWLTLGTNCPIYAFIYIYIYKLIFDFPGGSNGEAFIYNAGYLGLIPVL